MARNSRDSNRSISRPLLQKRSERQAPTHQGSNNEISTNNDPLKVEFLRLEIIGVNNMRSATQGQQQAPINVNQVVKNVCRMLWHVDPSL